MIPIKTNDEVLQIQQAALLVSKTLAEVAKILKEGITTLYIDKLCETFVKDHGASLAFKNYRGFPFNICASINDVVVHGMPNNKPLKAGDIVSIDVGVILNNFVGDHAYTFILGEVSNDKLNLISNTKKALYKGIEKAIALNRVGDISYAIQYNTETLYKYGVVRELIGHGVGKELHEEPGIPNYGKMGKGPFLAENMVLAIEPMINLGKKEVYTCSDKWTVKTKDGLISAHFEHNVCVKKDTPIILSDFSLIEVEEKKNAHLNSSYY